MVWWLGRTPRPITLPTRAHVLVQSGLYNELLLVPGNLVVTIWGVQCSVNEIMKFKIM